MSNVGRFIPALLIILPLVPSFVSTSPLELTPTIQDTSGGRGGSAVEAAPAEEPVQEPVETRALEPAGSSTDSSTTDLSSLSGSKAEAVDPCSLPKEVGWGRAASRRYFFNKSSGRCEEFVFGGMCGNANNFETRKDCERLCRLKAR